MKVFTLFFRTGKHVQKTKKLHQWKIPKIDAVRDLVSGIDPEEVRKIHEETIDTLKKNRVFWEGTIGGHVVAGIDGVELFSSTKNPARTVLPGKTVQVKRNISIGVWSV